MYVCMYVLFSAIKPELGVIQSGQKNSSPLFYPSFLCLF